MYVVSYYELSMETKLHKYYIEVMGKDPIVVCPS